LLLSILFVLLGIVLLYVGGELLVDASIRLAAHFGLSRMVIGLTVVAFGTSCPELAASLTAALQGSPDITVGNVFGSNVANVGLILGVSVMITPFAATVTFLRREVAFMIAATVLVYPLMVDGELGRLQGLFLFLLLVGFVVVLLRDASARDVAPTVDLDNKKPWPVWLSSLGILGGVALLVGGAKSLVAGASDIALSFGVPERVIGFTLVALGTSLPELAASVAAARKGEGDIVLGNLVGSNIFNLLCILGLTALVIPIHVSPELMRLDYAAMLGTSVLMLLLLLSKLRLTRVEGTALIVIYFGYTAYLYLA